MKRILSAILPLCLSLALLSGCGAGAEAEVSATLAPTEAPTPSAAPTEAPTPTPEPTEEPTPKPEPTPSYVFGEPVPESEPVSPDWFDDAAFIGDSIMQTLYWYCEDSHPLGDVQFLCAGSLSATNALWDISDESVHPVYNGVKTRLEDAVADCGAKNVYIMLGTNNISFGIDKATSDMALMIGDILEKSPEANILIMSVPPMTRTSNIWYDDLNTDRINEYNEAMRALCAENGWYFVDVGPEFRDDEGNLDTDYCSDPYGMGIHFTNEAAQLWIDYLLTHVPEPLK